MKSIITKAAFLLALWTPLPQARAQAGATGGTVKYLLVNLDDKLGGTAAAANAINDRGWAMGAATLAGNTTEHAMVWVYGKAIDLGTLGGPSSSVAWSSVKNKNGMVAGVSDTSIVDPLGEIWSCAEAFFPSSSGHTCQGFVWQGEQMNALPTLGGNNGVAAGVNDAGQIAGWAETTTADPTCIAPQVLRFEAVIYQPNKNTVTPLAPLPGDPDSAATAINDHGVAVGISGLCSNAVGGDSAQHAVLWENGAPMDIGNLGGVAWNTPTAINNHGTVVGFSDLPGDSAATPNYHAFLWTKNGGITDLGTLPGDNISIAWGINESGQVVGQSIGPNGSRAFLWQKGVMTDLNTLVAQGPLSLVYANDINDASEIVGGASNSTTGDSPAFLAVPLRTQ